MLRSFLKPGYGREVWREEEREVRTNSGRVAGGGRDVPMALALGVTSAVDATVNDMSAASWRRRWREMVDLGSATDDAGGAGGRCRMFGRAEAFACGVFVAARAECVGVDCATECGLVM